MTELTVSWVRALPTGVRWVSLLGLMFMLAFALQPGSWLQLPVAFLFLTTCPGLLLVDWMEFSDFVVGLTMVVASSVATNIVVSVILVGTATYSPFTGMVATISTTLALAYVSYSRKRSTDRGYLPMRVS